MSVVLEYVYQRFDELDIDVDQLVYFDAAGNGVPCGGSWISARKKCSKGKAAKTPKDRLKAFASKKRKKKGLEKKETVNIQKTLKVKGKGRGPKGLSKGKASKLAAKNRKAKGLRDKDQVQSDRFAKGNLDLVDPSQTLPAGKKTAFNQWFNQQRKSALAG